MGRHGNPEVQMNAQGGEILNEEELNRDWLDWVYTFSRAAILLSIVYFYSSFSRFVMVMMAMLVLYLWVYFKRVLNARHYNTVTRTTLKHSSNSETEIKRICSTHGDTLALTGRVYILLDSGIV